MQEKSLAQFVQEKRERLGLSTGGLANKCNLDVEILENIESGHDLFLPTTIRQNLAKGLKCSLLEIKKYEKKFDNHFADEDTIETLKGRVLRGDSNLICPKCGSLLVTRIAKMYDLEDNLVLHPKARCTKCPFQIKD